jgi:hypothetical protein
MKVKELLQSIGFNGQYFWAHDQWWISYKMYQLGPKGKEVYLAWPAEGELPCPLQLVQKEDWIDDVRG